MRIIEKHLSSFIFGICAIICFAIATNAFIENKKLNKNSILVTGSASKDFVSDLIVWRGDFSKVAETQKQAYAMLKEDAKLIKEYLTENSVNPDEVTFTAVSIYEKTHEEKINDPNTGESYYSTVFDGYELGQTIIISSNDVDKVEIISRDITSLIDKGISFSSSAPEYYYTKLDELKIQMIEEATANSKLRAQKIADNAGSKLGELAEANLGVFQITATNSAADMYDSMGAFNTSSKLKTVQVTVKLNYRIN